ncbi:MAG TPA: DUF58 domain-containing protein [Candidatus Acidoferrum sp.]|nr:DUF58 domain-containing protein [Candidatus Acidoferrum sp.]
MAANRSILAELWAKADRPGVRAFFLSISALGVALVLALYSGVAAEFGNVLLAGTCALLALAVAGWVAVTLVPTLAKRTPLRWIGYKMEYKVTRAGWIYIGATLVIALAALNTGNNLLFLILACLIANILMSGFLSYICLTGVELNLEMPEHIFAGHTERATVELANEKMTMPSFSLTVEAVTPENAKSSTAVLQSKVYFPYLPRRESQRQRVPVTFPHRGVFRQDTFRIATRFPFGFLQKARRLEMKKEVLVYPSVETLADFAEIFTGIEGALESMSKGRGQDLYALREYLPTDSARHVHWKASARLGALMVREFTLEEDFRVLLVLDPHLPPETAVPESPQIQNPRFERAVTLCAGLAWHFFERGQQLQFRSTGIGTPLGSGQTAIFGILEHLAKVQPLPFDPSHMLMQELASEPDIFKIIVTSQKHGTIPATLWHSSYVLFLDDFVE